MEHLRFAPGILKRLGEELNPHPDQGIIELVRNAYDADASTCCIELSKTERPGGTIRITDDGSGMSRGDLVNGWLILGKSAKQVEKLTPSGRRVVGNKGLGRLAALRLGQVATVETQAAATDSRLRLRLDWNLFDQADVVESVDLRIESLPKLSAVSGSIITIDNVRTALTRNDVKRLARSLVLLADPFGGSRSFKPTLVAREFEDLEKLVDNGYFDQADLHLVAALRDGKATTQVLDYKGDTVYEGSHEQLRANTQDKSRRYESPNAVFDLWIFNLDNETFSTRNVTLTEVREWLREVGGVHLYDRGLRVHPYGDKGHDWLDMNLSRARNPELRPSTNTSLGRVAVDDERGLLIQKTDRTGFIENQGFNELRQFAVDALDWLARKRLQQREGRRAATKADVPPNIRQAESTIRQALHDIAPESRRAVEAAVEQYQKARDREARSLREDLQLYRTLSTVGTTSAVLAHELKKPVRQIESMAKMVQRAGLRELGDRYARVMGGPVNHILRASESLKTFANVTTTLLERDKRRPGRISVSAVIGGILDLMKPFLDDAKVRVVPIFVEEEPAVFGSIASCESIVANLITNSINAFSYPHAPANNRIVEIETAIDPAGLNLRVSDSGPGIQGLDLKEIWLPGQTTTPGGTGLGLTIVKDAVTELGGTISALANGRLGGAEFTVRFPTTGS